MKAPAIVVAIGKGPAKGKEPMAGPDPMEHEADEEKAETGSEFRTALGEAVDALSDGDRETAIDALSAAITAKCTEMYAEKE